MNAVIQPKIAGILRAVFVVIAVKRRPCLAGSIRTSFNSVTIPPVVALIRINGTSTVLWKSALLLGLAENFTRRTLTSPVSRIASFTTLRKTLHRGKTASASGFLAEAVGSAEVTVVTDHGNTGLTSPIGTAFSSVTCASVITLIRINGTSTVLWKRALLLRLAENFTRRTLALARSRSACFALATDHGRTGLAVLIDALFRTVTEVAILAIGVGLTVARTSNHKAGSIAEELP